MTDLPGKTLYNTTTGTRVQTSTSEDEKYNHASDPNTKTNRSMESHISRSTQQKGQLCYVHTYVCTNDAAVDGASAQGSPT